MTRPLPEIEAEIARLKDERDRAMRDCVSALTRAGLRVKERA